MSKWYNKYEGMPYRHLGNNPTEGIDCFNLCRLVFKQEKDINIKYDTSYFCNIVDEDWYQKTTDKLFEDGSKVHEEGFGWLKVRQPKPFDLIGLSLGSTNITNHCAMYVDTNRILQIVENRLSYVTIYGTYYKQYTTGIYRWNPLNN